MKRAAWCAGILLLLLGGCEAAEDVKVQPLPSLNRPGPEERAGLPVVGGVWRFAGWEIPPRDTAAARAGLVPPGEIRVGTQRLDSVAGMYVREGAQFPFVGEVRRDSVLSVVVFDAQGAGSFVTGRVRRDTLWVELTSLPSAQGWPAGTRAALVRGRVGAPFTRFPGLVVPPPADTTLRDSLARPDSAGAPVAAPAPVTPAPQTTAPRTATPQQTTPAPAPPAARPRIPTPRTTPPAQRPTQTPPRDTQPPPRDTQPPTTQPPTTPRLPVPEVTPARPDTVPTLPTPPPPSGTGVAHAAGGSAVGNSRPEEGNALGQA